MKIGSKDKKVKVASALLYSLTFFVFFIFYLVIRGIANATGSQYYFDAQRDLYTIKAARTIIIICLISLYPLFKRVSRNIKVNRSRVFVGIPIIITTFLFFLIPLIKWGLNYASYYDVSLREFYSMDTGFAARLSLYLTNIAVGIMLILPFFKIKERKIDYSYRKVDSTHFILRLIERISKRFSTYFSREVNGNVQKNVDMNKNINSSSVDIQNVAEIKEEKRLYNSRDEIVNKLSELEKLFNLKKNGVINNDEFSKLKEDILNRDK